jgi:hypothetical protein
MDRNDAGATTIGAYLTALLVELWQQEEGFSGKRPFGNSDWKFDVYKALIKGGAVPGKLDADGCVEDCDNVAADEAVLVAIETLARASS